MDAPSAFRRAFVRFTAGSLLALLGVGIASTIIANSLANQVTLREARMRGTALAQIVAAPLVNWKTRQGDKSQLGVLNAVLGDRIREGPLLHIKMWDSTGRVLWSDEPGLRGQTFPLPEPVAALFGTENVLAEKSEPGKGENVKELGEKPLLEVYAGAYDADGVPLVFESYWSPGSVAHESHIILTRLAPLALGSLALFQLAVFPLAMSLARRVDRGQTERTKMLGHALSASDLERRRIAQHLHDGVVQDLAGLGLALPTIRSQLPATKKADGARRVLEEMNNVVRRDIDALRHLLTDLYPVGLETGGLQHAVEVLASRREAALGEVTVDVAGVAGEQVDDVRLMYRVVREGLRNVAAHAEATHTSVRAVRQGGMLEVTVSDDGKGISPGHVPSGHFGLRLLSDLLLDVGGRLDAVPRAGGGTVLRAAFPAGVAGTHLLHNLSASEASQDSPRPAPAPAT